MEPRINTIAAFIGREPIKPIPLVEGPRMHWPQLDRMIAEARREMGEARWAELNAEWE